MNKYVCDDRLDEVALNDKISKMSDDEFNALLEQAKKEDKQENNNK